MTHSHELDEHDLGPARLVREWLIHIRTPVGGVDAVLEALTRDVPLRQGAYDCCSYITAAGQQRFRALEGSHAGAEGTIQSTSTAEIVVSIPPDRDLLDKVFRTVFAVHVNEEPTIQVQEVWGSRSHYLDDKDNPNRYWNRADADALHGTRVATGPEAGS